MAPSQKKIIVVLITSNHFMRCFTSNLAKSLFSGSPSVPTLTCGGLSKDIDGAVNITVNWTLSGGGDGADFHFINITTNALRIPYGGLLNVTTASVTQYELTGFQAGYDYNITVLGVNCGSQKGHMSHPLTITPQSMCHCKDYMPACAPILLSYICTTDRFCLTNWIW